MPIGCDEWTSFSENLQRQRLSELKTAWVASRLGSVPPSSFCYSRQVRSSSVHSFLPDETIAHLQTLLARGRLAVWASDLAFRTPTMSSIASAAPNCRLSLIELVPASASRVRQLRPSSGTSAFTGWKRLWRNEIERPLSPKSGLAAPPKRTFAGTRRVLPGRSTAAALGREAHTAEGISAVRLSMSHPARPSLSALGWT